MKKLIILFILTPFFFASCDKIKDATTEDFYTTLRMEIPVEVVDTTTTEKSTNASYSFSVSQTESLESNEKIQDYLDLLKLIEVTDVDIDFSGLVNEQVIETIELSIENVGTIATIENVSASNPTHHPEINSSVLINIANLLYHEKKLKMTVSGTTNAAPMNFVVDTSFDLHIEASPL
jgi:hypothetical protein